MYKEIWPTWVSVCWRTRQNVCRCHPPHHASLWTLSSSLGPAALKFDRKKYHYACRNYTFSNVPIHPFYSTQRKYSVPSRPELRRCSPRSQPNTRSFRIPLCFSFCLVGLDFMKVRRKPISLPCFLDTAKRGRQRANQAHFHTLHSVHCCPHTQQGISVKHTSLDKMCSFGITFKHRQHLRCTDGGFWVWHKIL